MGWFNPLRRKPPKPAAEGRDTPGGAERVCIASEEGATGAKYSLADPRVAPPVRPLTEEDYRHLVAEGLLRPTHDQGPTRVGLTIGCDEKTVRGARDKRSTLRGDLSWNMLLVDEHALDPLAARFRKRLVDLDPAPVDWAQLGAAAADLSAEIFRALAKGHVSHVDQPKLKTLVRRVMALGQGAA